MVARDPVTPVPPAPRLSVVICTRNRARVLPEALACYPRLTADFPWELIVVDNGSSDGTREVLERFAATVAFPVRVVSEPRKGLSRARNRGWRLARAAIVVFTDDDCYPEPDFLTRILECFERRPIGYLGGRILLYDKDDFPITILKRDSPLVLEPGTFIDTGVVQGANMSARREALEAVGGFDEMLGAGTPFCSEDIDFVGRLSAAGYAGAYDPAPLVLHHHRRRASEEVRALARTYDIGRGAYFMKCLLEPARRRPAWVAIRSTVRMHLEAGRRGSRRHLLRIVYELRGALGYLGARLVRRVAGASGGGREGVDSGRE
ncbi:MAG TPA: glycosyltransferase family A protein [Dongiaceae bacterium]|nr:glycosyltransferase family A protein [Dongiaceae bacterium]